MYFSKLLIPFLTCDAHFYCSRHLPRGHYDADFLAVDEWCDD
jgi:hypothetical protein